MNDQGGRLDKYRILVVEDHDATRRGLMSILEDEPDLEVCGSTGSVAAALLLVEKTRPDLAIIDISLKEGSGIELIKHLRKRDRSLKILVFSYQEEDLFAERAIRAGAKGYVNKSESNSTLVTAIRQVLAGRLYVSAKMADRFLFVDREEREGEASPLNTLSDRELEVFDLVSRGMRTREIAAVLHVSIKTVETHENNIKKKLNLGNKNQLVRQAALWSAGNTLR